MKSTRYTWITDSLWLAIGIGLFYALFLGTRALGVPDEARYAEIPREMIATGHYLIPHLDFIKYFEKPDLYYWLQALSIKLFGLSEWSLRFWNAAFGVTGCVIIYLAGRKLFNRRTGIYAALILATSILYYALSHLITLDTAVSFFITCALLAFIIAFTEPVGKSRRIYMYLAATAASAAVLTKGLIGFVFPCMIIGCWVLLLNQWRLLTKIYLPTTLLLFLVLTVPWHIAMAVNAPDWAYFYFIQQQFLRYATTDAGRYQPVWFFIPIVIAGFFPWTVFLVQAIKNHWPRWSTRQSHAVSIFLLLWAGLIFLFFSFSDSKLIPYILPVLPPIALITAHYLAKAYQTIRDTGQPITIGLRAGFIALPCLGTLFGVALFFLIPQMQDVEHVTLAKHLLIFIAFLIVATSLISSWVFFRRRFHGALIALLIGMGIMLVTLNTSAGFFDNRSIKPLALQLRPLLTPQSKVVAYNHYYQDLPFYLRRRVIIVGWRNELTFGMNHQDVSGWVWSAPQLWEKWQSDQPLFIMMRKSAFDDVRKQRPHLHFYIIGQTTRNILLSNQEPAT